VSLTTIIILLVVGLIIREIIRERFGRDARSDDSGRRGGCPTGKVEFATRGDANSVVRRSKADRGRGYDRPLQRSYHCPHCGSWHTTSRR
jgi:hypothetical protein